MSEELDAIARLRSLDPAANLQVDVDALLNRVTSEAQIDAPAAEVISLQTVRTQGVSTAARRWLTGYGIAAAAVAVVATTGVIYSYQHLQPAGDPTRIVASVDPTHTPSHSTPSAKPSAGVKVEKKGAVERLEKVGEVSFVAPANFSATPTKAPVYEKVATVTKADADNVARSLGLGGVQATGEGFRAQSSEGALLMLTVGDLASLFYENPAAAPVMECVPVETPTPTPTEAPEPSPSATDAGTPDAGVNPAPAAPTQQPSGRGNSLAQVTNPEDNGLEFRAEFTGEVGALVLPERQLPDGFDDASMFDGVIEIGQTSALENDDPEPSPSESAPGLAGNTPAPDPSPSCVMRSTTPAPGAYIALEKVSSTIEVLGGEVTGLNSVQMGEGVTSLQISVKLPEREKVSLWDAQVSQRGVISIRASLGEAKKVGEKKIISQKEAVERLNDPAFGPIDVYDPSGTARDAKISGEVVLVKAEVSSEMVTRSNGNMESVPVYRMTDTAGRVWTVLASAF